MGCYLCQNVYDDVHMCAFIYTCQHAYTRYNMHINMHVNMHMHVTICMSTCMSICIYMLSWWQRLSLEYGIMSDTRHRMLGTPYFFLS